MRCPKCEKLYPEGEMPDGFGDMPVCAFPDGRFSTDNWNCATINKIREYIELQYDEAGFYSPAFRDRWEDCSIGVLRMPEGYHLVLTWYKERGTVGDAIVLRDGIRREFTLKDAEEIMEMYK